MAAGYCKRTLVQKLGIKSGFKLAILFSPEGYDNTLGPLPAAVTRLRIPAQEMDFIQYFARFEQRLQADLPALKDTLAPNGMPWVSWPKTAARMDTDLNGGKVRGLGLAIGLVDVKVCAVDEKWSGLKFVYRLKDRP